MRLSKRKHHLREFHLNMTCKLGKVEKNEQPIWGSEIAMPGARVRAIFIGTLVPYDSYRTFGRVRRNALFSHLSHKP